MGVDLHPGERKIDSWSLFQTTSRGRIGGKLIVTDKRILFDAKYDASIGKLADGDFDKVTGMLEIDRSRVREVKADKSFFSKKVHVTTADGVKYTFDRGMMSIDPVVEAMKK